MDLQSVSAADGEETLSSGESGRFSSNAREEAMRRLAPRDCDIRLTLPARPENVAVVRHVVAALAESFALPPKLIEDIRLAVTEACTNVVRHAYTGEEGPLEVRVEPDPECLTVVVSDRGHGIKPSPDSEGPGLGLPLIAALASSLEIEHSPESGSSLCMSFRAGDGAVEAA
jgi:serine/threonine-protein kinase RsbW